MDEFASKEMTMRLAGWLSKRVSIRLAKEHKNERAGGFEAATSIT